MVIIRLECQSGQHYGARPAVERGSVGWLWSPRRPATMLRLSPCCSAPDRIKGTLIKDPCERAFSDILLGLLLVLLAQNLPKYYWLNTESSLTPLE